VTRAVTLAAGVLVIAYLMLLAFFFCAGVTWLVLAVV
jgi:hypothetical protein